MEFMLKEFGKKEILSIYRRYMARFFAASALISEGAIRWLIAKNICSSYGLYDDRKHLICFGVFINDKEKRTLLLDYFAVLKKYRGYNYPEIFFEMVKEMMMGENMPFGIFLEVKKAGEKEFYREMGAYMTDIVQTFSEDGYNIMFLPVNEKLSRSELKTEFLNIYKEILPSFNEKKKYIIRLTEEVDGLV